MRVRSPRAGGRDWLFTRRCTSAEEICKETPGAEELDCAERGRQKSSKPTRSSHENRQNEGAKKCGIGGEKRKNSQGGDKKEREGRERRSSRRVRLLEKMVRRGGEWSRERADALGRLPLSLVALRPR